MTLAEPDCVGSATAVAVTATVAGEGTDAGAVYRPVEVIVPQVEPLQPAPESFQVTAVFVLPLTVAVNCCCAPIATCTEEGVTPTETAAEDWMTTLAEADLVGSATDVALTVASAGLGTVAGAVYKPVELTVPHEPDTQPIPVTVQLTLVFVVPVTVAVNCCCPLTEMVTEEGETITPTLVEPTIVTAAVPN